MKNLNFKNKRGNIQDILMLVIIVVFFILLAIPTMKIVSKVIDQQQNDDTNSVETKQDLTDMGTKFYRGVDLGFLFMLVLGCIAILVSAYFIDIHPIFAIIGLLLSIILLIGCVSLSKVAQDLIEKTPEVFTYLPITTYVTNHIFLFVVIFLGLLFLVLYGKYRG